MESTICPNFTDLLDYLKKRLNIEDEGVILQSLEREDVEKVKKSDFKEVLIRFRRTYENATNVNKKVYEIAEEHCKDIYEKFCLENKHTCGEVLNWCNDMRKKTWEEADRELLSKLTNDENEIKSIHEMLRDMYSFASDYTHGDIEVIWECSYLIDKFKSAIYFLEYLSSLKTDK